MEDDEESLIRDPDVEHGDFIDAEPTWLQRFEFLKDSGYILRPRYRPGWRPPWKMDGFSYIKHEEAITPSRAKTLDAIRIDDGTPVFLKCVENGNPEIAVDEYLRTLPKDPRNHTVPLLDILRNPDEPEVVILVLPLLRPVTRPPIESLREAMDFVRQTLEGLVFLHEYKVAHRDCNWPNIMMDGDRLYPQGWHPQADYLQPDGNLLEFGNRASRTAIGGVRYYFIDFGIASIGKDLVYGTPGQIRAPELSDEVPYNPYKLDVYIMGASYEDLIIKGTTGAECLLSLIVAMKAENPGDRPTAQEALDQFHAIMSSLPLGALGQRLHSAKSSPTLIRWLGDVQHKVLDFWWTIRTTRG